MAIHFQEWWIRHRAQLPAEAFVMIGIDDAKPAPGVIQAISDTDLVILPPSNPVVSVGAILQVAGIADAIRNSSAPVVGVSPIIGGAPVRGMADACLEAIGVPTSAAGVALHYGSRSAGGYLDAWLVADEDADSAAQIAASGMRVAAAPLLMSDLQKTAAIAAATLGLMRA